MSLEGSTNNNNNYRHSLQTFAVNFFSLYNVELSTDELLKLRKKA